MEVTDSREDAAAYARRFAHFEHTGTRFLAYRDVPMLIKKNVSGVVALDYGCGPGGSSRFLKPLGLEVDGVDINPEMIKLSKEKDPTGNYTPIKSAEIPADDNHYDLVFSGLVFQEVSSKQELSRIMREITRVLKVGGTFIAILPATDCYNSDWISANTEFEENKHLQSGCIVKILIKEINLIKRDYYWSEEDYREIIHEAGLNIVQEHIPLGTDEDGFVWINEKEKSPVTIYVAKKLSDGGSCHS